MEKGCSRCKKTLPVDNFSVRGKKKDGSPWYQSMCKPCRKEYNREMRNKPLDPNATYPENRKCFTCKEVKKLQKDFPSTGVQNGKKTWGRDCRKCHNKKRQKYLHEVYLADPKNREKTKEKRHQRYLDNRDKELDYSKKYHEENKDRINARHRISDKEWYKKNAEYKKAQTAKRREDPEYRKAEREYSREYYRENTEKEKERGKRYKKENAEKILRESRERYKTDPLYNLKKRLRARTLTAFKRRGWKKDTKTQETLKGEWEEVKLHVEATFVNGMSWDNIGEWDIDHVIPLAAADNEQELIALGHYKNLQAMWSSTNYSKGDGYDEDDKRKYFEWYEANVEKLK